MGASGCLCHGGYGAWFAPGLEEDCWIGRRRWCSCAFGWFLTSISSSSG
uniref:Uncharacterized protein n=1 Tax=Arundo donax TaxID=35708 RepID=A0A0A9AUS4_ARUDO